MPSLRKRVQAGETLFGVWSDLGSPLAAELLANTGFDWVTIDLEHGAAPEADLISHLLAVELRGAAPIVRPQSAERLRIGRALDLGAAGIVVPRLDTAEQARQAVTFLRYPPAGGRGVALRTRGARLGAIGHGDVAVVNDDIVGIIQIETTGGLAEADAIAALDGVDILFVGPADLSHSLGVPGRFSEQVYQEALRSVVAACRRHGKAAGILLYDHATFGPQLELGFTFIGLGADGAFVAGGAKAALAAGRAAVPSAVPSAASVARSA